MELPAFLFFSDKMMRTCCLFVALFFLFPPSFCWGEGGLSFCSFLSSIRSLSFYSSFPLLLFYFLFLLNFFLFLFLSFSFFLAFFSLFLSSFLSIFPFHSAGFCRNYPILKQRASHVRCFKLLYINVNNGDRIGHSILRSSSLFKSCWAQIQFSQVIAVVFYVLSWKTFASTEAQSHDRRLNNFCYKLVHRLSSPCHIMYKPMFSSKFKCGVPGWYAHHSALDTFHLTDLTCTSLCRLQTSVEQT